MDRQQMPLFQVSVAVARKEALDRQWNTELFSKQSRIVPFARLYLPLEGEGEVQCSGKLYRLTPGRMLLMPPMAALHLKCPERLVKYWCHFNARLEDSGLDLFSTLQDCLEYEVPEGDRAFVEGLFARLVRLCSKENGTQVSRMDEFLCRSALCLLLEPFLETLLRRGPQKQLPKIYELLAFMQNNMSSPVNMRELGRKAGMHPNYLSRLFRQEMGMAPMSYWRYIRLNHAALMMQQSMYSIGEIAQETGFPDVSSFSRLFRKHAGMGPREYRKRLKSPEDAQ